MGVCPRRHQVNLKPPWPLPPPASLWSRHHTLFGAEGYFCLSPLPLCSGPALASLSYSYLMFLLPRRSAVCCHTLILRFISPSFLPPPSLPLLPVFLSLALYYSEREGDPKPRPNASYTTPASLPCCARSSNHLRCCEPKQLVHVLFFHQFKSTACIIYQMI